MASLEELEVRVAKDFCDRAAELVGIYAARLSDAALRQQAMFEGVKDTIGVEIFREVRPLMWAAREAIAAGDVPAIKEHAHLAALQRGSRKNELELMTEAIQLWETAPRRDRKASLALARAMVGDVAEWVELGGSV